MVIGRSPDDPMPMEFIWYSVEILFKPLNKFGISLSIGALKVGRISHNYESNPKSELLIFRLAGKLRNLFLV